MTWWLDRGYGVYIMGGVCLMENERKASESEASRVVSEATELAKLRLRVPELETSRDGAVKAWQVSEERYRSLFNRIPVGLYRTSPEGQVLEANPAALQMFGYPDLASLQAVNIADLYLNAEDQRRWKALIEQEQVVTAFEAQMRRRDGLVIWVRDSAQIVRGADGQVSCYEGVLEEITAWKRLQAQLTQAQKLEVVGRLAGGVAHDFNNMLTAIQGYVGFAMEDLDPAVPCYEDLKRVSAIATRAANVVRQLLIFSRRQPMQFAALDLNDEVEGVLKMLGHLIGENIAIKVNITTGLWPIQGDATNIEQVIVNLAINARDAMPEGGELTLGTENRVLDEAFCRLIPDARPGRYVCLSVEDTGIGMDEEVKQHLFEPFFTTKSPEGGTGLGLATAYGIVKGHGGWISAKSEPGQGTTFSVYLPASLLEGPTVDEKAVSVAAPGSQGERILLVEDEGAIRECIGAALERSGYTVLVATNVTEALKIFGKEEGQIDLLFSDVILPDGNGLGLADELTYHKPDLRVLLSSGYFDGKSGAEAIGKKGYGFLLKPYLLADLLRAIRKVINPG
jgi:two-component system cell cycle sensor histidine kinase/response regulator CckA